jgi:hypothetical protein
MHLTEAEFQSRTLNGTHIAPMDSPKNCLFDLIYGVKRIRVKDVAQNVLNDPTVFKFTVVRHPWNRLVSGYLNKYVFGCNESRICFQKEYVKNLDTSLRETLSLTELLLTLEHTPTKDMNQHFRPSTEVCNVRDGPYDFIADMENPSHTDYLLAKIKSPFPFPQDNNSLQEIRNPEDLKVACTRETVDLAARLYAADLKTYGYTMDAAYESCEKYGLAHPPK